MERFSIECRKNPKQNNSNNQSEQRNILLRTKTIKLPKARENAADQVVIAFRVHLIGRESGASFFRPITDRSKANPKYSRITFDIQLKMSLFVRQFMVCV